MDNLKKNTLKIWKDPVWSKVISQGIIMIIGLAFVWGQSIYKKISIYDSIIQTYNYPIKFGWILIVIILIS